MDYEINENLWNAFKEENLVEPPSQIIDNDLDDIFDYCDNCENFGITIENHYRVCIIKYQTQLDVVYLPMNYYRNHLWGQ